MGNVSGLQWTWDIILADLLLSAVNFLGIFLEENNDHKFLSIFFN